MRSMPMGIARKANRVMALLLWLVPAGIFVQVPFWMSQAPQADTGQPTYQDLAPLFNRRCVICHNGPGAPRKLQLDSYAHLLEGSENGPVVIAGRPEESELIRRVKGMSLPRMPLTGPPWLSESEISRLEAWIRAGMPEKPARGARPMVADSLNPPPVPPPGEGVVTFRHVEPIFRLRCQKCHQVRGLLGAPPEGFRVDSYSRLIASTDRARVVPGYPLASELVRRIRGLAHPRMPFDGPPYLEPDQIALIERWIREGARNASGKPAPYPTGARVRLHGTLSAQWALDGYPLQISSATRLKKAPVPGSYVEVRGRLRANGQIEVSRLRPR